MKNKMKLIIPRLIGLTAIVGLASIIISALFKLLFFGTILLALGMLFAWIIRSWKKESTGSELMHEVPYLRMHTQQRQAVVPVVGFKKSAKPSIIPIY